MKDAVLHLEVSPTKVRITAGPTVVASKLIDGTFPDYSRVIPLGNDQVARIDKAGLVAAVDRVSTVANEKGRAVKFGFRAGALHLSATNADMGAATDEVEAEYAGDEFDIGFNSRYVLDILSAIPAGTAHVALKDPGSPCLITTGAPSPLFVLMPMRV